MIDQFLKDKDKNKLDIELKKIESTDLKERLMVEWIEARFKFFKKYYSLPIDIIGYIITDMNVIISEIDAKKRYFADDFNKVAEIDAKKRYFADDFNKVAEDITAKLSTEYQYDWSISNWVGKMYQYKIDRQLISVERIKNYLQDASIESDIISHDKNRFLFSAQYEFYILFSHLFYVLAEANMKEWQKFQSQSPTIDLRVCKFKENDEYTLELDLAVFLADLNKRSQAQKNMSYLEQWYLKEFKVNQHKMVPIKSDYIKRFILRLKNAITVICFDASKENTLIQISTINFFESLRKIKEYRNNLDKDAERKKTELEQSNLDDHKNENLLEEIPPSGNNIDEIQSEPKPSIELEIKIEENLLQLEKLELEIMKPKEGKMEEIHLTEEDPLQLKTTDEMETTKEIEQPNLEPIKKSKKKKSSSQESMEDENNNINIKTSVSQKLNLLQDPKIMTELKTSITKYLISFQKFPQTSKSFWRSLRGEIRQSAQITFKEKDPVAAFSFIKEWIKPKVDIDYISIDNEKDFNKITSEQINKLRVVRDELIKEQKKLYETFIQETNLEQLNEFIKMNSYIVFLAYLILERSSQKLFKVEYYWSLYRINSDKANEKTLSQSMFNLDTQKMTPVKNSNMLSQSLFSSNQPTDHKSSMPVEVEKTTLGNNTPNSTGKKQTIWGKISNFVKPKSHDNKPQYKNG